MERVFGAEVEVEDVEDDVVEEVVEDDGADEVVLEEELV